MAHAIRHVFRHNYLGNITVRNIDVLGNVSAKRYLFSHEKLGIENFRRQRTTYFDKLEELKPRFCKEVQAGLEKPTPVVFTADLKTMVHMADLGELDLLENMVRIYQKQQTDLAFSTFHFGPLVMRLLYIMNDTDRAFSLFTDEEIQKSGFFDQMSSHVVLLDLLFVEERYDEMYQIADIVKDKQLNGVAYPMDCATLVLAACLKQNTAESYQKMLAYVKGIRDTGQDLSHRSVGYASMLALKQGKYVEASEIMSLAPALTGRRRQPVALQNIKILTAAKHGRLEEGMMFLRSILENDVPDHLKTGSEIFSDVFLEMKTPVEASNNLELTEKFKALEKGLYDGNHIVNGDFEAFLYRKIVSPRKYQDGYKHKQAHKKYAQYKARTG